MVYVSVVMPSYNYDRYVGEAIESVLGQTFSDLELIVIDDASGDHSQEVISKYRRTDPRVRPVFHKINKGVAETLNEGIGLATGKYVAFLSSDDMWSRDKLEKQIGILSGNPDLVVWTEGEVINSEGKSLKRKAPDEMWRGSRLEKLTGQFIRNGDLSFETLDRHDSPGALMFTDLFKAGEKKKTGNIFNDLVSMNYVLGSSLIVRKENLKGMRFDPGLKYLNDYLLYLELARKCEFYFIDEPLVRYRLHGSNSTLRDSLGWDMDSLTMNELLLRRYGQDIHMALKSKLLCINAIIYLKMGVTDLALRYLYDGVRMHPQHAYYALTLTYLWAKKAYVKDYYPARAKSTGAGHNKTIP